MIYRANLVFFTRKCYNSDGKMPRMSFVKVIAFTIFISAVLFLACRPKTDENRIRELLQEAAQDIEQKDISRLTGLLSDDYTDQWGRDKNQTKDMVETYFSEFRGIVIHVLGTRFDELDLAKASIQTDVALSSGAARALRKLVPASPDNYRFEITLVKKQDRWLITYARWKYIDIEELFPESLSLFKNLFQDK
jgi:ketosteroid isomerase-like protein